MSKITCLATALIGLFLCSCSSRDKDVEVVFETTMGTIEMRLYNQTPLHRDNFVSLVKEGAYDGLLFHRVIKDFMAQAGDPDSKDAPAGKLLGDGDRPYTVPAEFRLEDGIYHKRGVIAAAREGDDVNPEQSSSAMQFYIVWGKIFDDEGIADVQKKLDDRTSGKVKLTSEMIETYKTVGGTPHLDGQYTVFGEVTKGMDVVYGMMLLPTDENDRPWSDVRILRAYIKDNIIIAEQKPEPTWSDEFNGDTIDWSVWSKVPKGDGGWWTYMSDYDGCYEMRDGCLILKGMKNPGIEGCDQPYVQGGVWTKDKKTFGYGRIEIRAKIGEARGSWPALWMMPECWDYRPHTVVEAEKYWAEIDICEKLGFDDFAYQTLHNNFSLNPEKGKNHIHGGKGPIKRNDFNIYAVEHYRDSIKLFVNDVCSLTYVRNPELGIEQWNYDQQYELFIDMQLGGSDWPGPIEDADLPIEMAIDWVRYYEFSE